MIDRLRLFVNRPLSDADRPRLFLVAVGVIGAVAAILALLDDAGPAPRPVRSTRVAVAPPAPATPTPTPAAPSEESAVEVSSRDVARSKRAARRFLRRYLPYTYGRGQASRLPAATPELRAQLAAARPRVPARERTRRPRLELLQSNGVSRERARLVAIVRDGRRRYTVSLELANTAAGWLVSGLGR